MICLCAICIRCLILDNTNINVHLIVEVLVSSNEGIAIAVLETYTSAALIEAVKVLHSSDDGVCSIVWKYVYTHWEARTILGVVGHQKLESDMLWLHWSWCGHHILMDMGCTLLLSWCSCRGVQHLQCLVLNVACGHCSQLGADARRQRLGVCDRSEDLVYVCFSKTESCISLDVNER